MSETATAEKPSPDPPYKLLSIEALCRRWGVSRTTVYAVVSDPKFPKPVKLVLRNRRWRPEDVARWEDRQR